MLNKSAKKTNYDQDFEELRQQCDSTKHVIHKLLKETPNFLHPNPGLCPYLRAVVRRSGFSLQIPFSHMHGASAPFHTHTHTQLHAHALQWAALLPSFARQQVTTRAIREMNEQSKPCYREERGGKRVCVCVRVLSVCVCVCAVCVCVCACDSIALLLLTVLLLLLPRVFRKAEKRYPHASGVLAEVLTKGAEEMPPGSTLGLLHAAFTAPCVLSHRQLTHQPSSSFCFGASVLLADACCRQCTP